jgi:hypothetical protein
MPQAKRFNYRSNPKPFRAKPKPDGYVFGRPTLYRPEYCQRAIVLMGEGYDLTAFAGSIGVSRDTVYGWIEAHKDFSDAIKIAQAARLLALQRKLLTTKIGVGVTAAIFALKNAAPDDWQDRYNTETNVNVRIESLSDQQLLAIAARGRTIEHDPTPLLQHANERQPVADETSD